jgi:peroxiredoxin-like protein
MNQHHFVVRGLWKGGLDGVGHIEAQNLKTIVSLPKTFNGAGVGTNPEELLIGAAATCFLVTFAAILKRREIFPERIEIETEGTLSTENGFQFTHLVHRPRIFVTDGTQTDTIKAVAHIAEKACVISAAIKGNIDVSVQPEVVTEIASNYVSV